MKNFLQRTVNKNKYTRKTLIKYKKIVIIKKICTFFVQKVYFLGYEWGNYLYIYFLNTLFQLKFHLYGNGSGLIFILGIEGTAPGVVFITVLTNDLKDAHICRFKIP